jgi:hypothetical protein
MAGENRPLGRRHRPAPDRISTQWAVLRDLRSPRGQFSDTRVCGQVSGTAMREVNAIRRKWPDDVRFRKND